MSTTTAAEIDARRTAVAMVRAAVDRDAEAAALLMGMVDDPIEVGLALESLARGLTAVSPAVPPAPAAGAGFDALVAYVGHHVEAMARADGTTTRYIFDQLALVALGR